MESIAQSINEGRYHDPFDFLGIHHDADKHTTIRVLLPDAETVELSTLGSMTRIENTDIFELFTDATDIPKHPLLKWQHKQTGEIHTSHSAYTFPPQIGELDIYLFAEGKHHHTWHFLGARLKTIDHVFGCQFAVWAPNVKRVSVVGSFNNWNGRYHPMRCRGQSGLWELFIPGITAKTAYKFEILTQHHQLIIKTDPYARMMDLRPGTNGLVAPVDHFRWNDREWMRQRRQFNWREAPISIYELHAGSWQRRDNGQFLNWYVLARQLIPYLKELHYTHVELLPISEHPLDESWGYQVSGYYAPTARHGSPDDFRYFVDQCHQNGIGVILDWVPAHFPKDDFALARFTGEPVYEHADPRRGEHKDWGTLIFDYGRNEVRNFLIANSIYWLEDFHIDGLRVDAVASMLYLDYSRKADEWLPNHYGGRENLDAIHFLREMNTVIHQRFPGVLTIAEESTAWANVTQNGNPTQAEGLGFSMKWNMGWMNDNLRYIEHDPIYRQHNHNLLTFSMMYAWTENFVLALSHDEVVHLKKSMLMKMPGSQYDQMANLRLFYAWQYAHPGKKLLFMGGELAQPREWDANSQLDWSLQTKPLHKGLQTLIKDLNQLYCNTPPLHQYDFEQHGFQWIDCSDKEHSVVSLIRRSESDFIVCLLNFTPVARHHYRLGVPKAKTYQEILNTDSTYYGGSNHGNHGEMTVEHVAWMNFEHSINITLPPLSALFLSPCKT